MNSDRTMGLGAEKGQVSILNYAWIAWKRRWIVLTVVLVLIVSLLIGLAGKLPLFSARAQVLLENPTPRFLGSDQGFFRTSGLSPETQVKLVKSTEFLASVARQLNQDIHASLIRKAKSQGELYDGEQLHTLLSGFRTISTFFRWQSQSLFGTEDGKENPSPAQEHYKAKSIGGSIEAKFIPRTEILEIVCTRSHPDEAALIANTVADLFVKDRLERRLKVLQEAVKWLQVQLKDEQVDLEKSRAVLSEFMIKHGMVGTEEKKSFKLDEEVDLLKERVRAAREKRRNLEMRHEQLKRLSNSLELMDTIPEAIGNKTLGDLRAQEIQLEQEAIKLAATYGQNHPRMMSVQNQLANIRRSKEQEVKKILNALGFELETAVIEEGALHRSLANLEKELDGLKRRTMEYYFLRREVESNEKVYNAILDRLKEATLSEELIQGPSATVIEKAVPPLGPSSPDVPRSLGIGLLIALALGFGLAFGLEYLEDTFTTPEQIEQLLKMTYLGAVPRLAAAKDGKKGEVQELITLAELKSPVSEAYRNLRTNILLSSADISYQVIVVTSAEKGEGKTLNAANLAIVMAQAGQRVLILDADLRRPRIHKLLKMGHEKGLSNLLADSSVDLDEVIQRSSEPNMDLIPSGPIPPNPSDLLGSKRMAAVMESLRKRYERIIIDSPPFFAATDSAVLTPIVDGFIIVVRAGSTKRQMVARGIKGIMDLNARIIGVILNDIPERTKGYYDYYYYYYYHYGDYYQDGGRSKGKRKKKGGVRQ